VLIRRVALALLVVPVVLGAAGCGGDDGRPSAWDQDAQSQLQSTAEKVAAAMPDECGDFAVADFAKYKANADALGGPVPLAVGGCTVAGEDIELSAFADASKRDQFTEQRTARLCEQTLSAATPINGLRWVDVGAVTLQPNTQETALAIAARTTGKYHPIECDGRLLDWSDAGRAQAKALAAKLPASMQCTGYTLRDRDRLAQNGQYVANGLPGAYGECKRSDGSAVFIASFRDSQTIRGDFVVAEVPFLCQQSSQVKAVVGPDWAVFLPNGDVADAVAKALAGDVYDPGC
jgi:hypothetical protein